MIDKLILIVLLCLKWDKDKIIDIFKRKIIIHIPLFLKVKYI